MNHSIIRRILFRVIQLTGVILLLPFIVALIYREWGCLPVFLIPSLICIILGTVLLKSFPVREEAFYAREGFVTTSLSWIIMSLILALPFRLTGVCSSYVDALFETISGLTTTGASILTSVEGMYRSVQFLRTFTHWIGGMGVLVFIMAIMPLAGGYGMHLMRAESPGPSVGKFVPKIKDTSRILYTIYMAFTAAETILLMLTGRTLYEALTLTFSTVGTGGFALTDSSIAGYGIGTQAVITVFMILCGVNFSVYYLLITKRPREAFRISELRTYLAVMFSSTVIIALMLIASHDPAAKTPFLAFHRTLFNVASIMTTTGFAVADFNLWPEFARTLLTLLTLLGACAGSTGGGFKISRLLILAKVVKNEIVFLVHPKSVKKVSMDGRFVDGTTVKSVCAYLIIYVFFMIFSWLAVSIDGFDTTTNFTAVAATLNNVGPGLGMVGATGNYSAFSPFSKIILMIDMLAGRLELLPILILLRPRTARRGHL